LFDRLQDIYNAVKAQPVAQSMRSSFSLLDGRSSLSLVGNASGASTPYNTMHRSPSRRSASSTSNSSAFKRSSIRGINSFISVPGLSRSASAHSNAPSLSEVSYSRSVHFHAPALMTRKPPLVLKDTTTTAYASKSTRNYPTIGFASNLSHTMVIKEHDDLFDEDNLPTDEELALSGAPWAKEGIIQRKHFWESPSKRAKDKTWLQVFVVISKGQLRMFRFDGTGTIKSNSSRDAVGGGVGGGDWMVFVFSTWITRSGIPDAPISLD
jgi:PH/SEC7 domain-containing protein